MIGHTERGDAIRITPVERLTLSLVCIEQGDGRWLAHLKEFPALSVLGDSWENAVDRVQALAETLIAARVRNLSMTFGHQCDLI